MASFLTGPAAQLVGAGMQAIGVGIPVGQTSAKVIEGLRDCGLPLPPKNWFKRKDDANGKDQQQSRDERAPSKTVYDKLESHINGMIQVVKPAIELKKLVRENCCKSAERPCKRASSESPKEKLRFYTPQKCSSTACNLFDDTRNSASAKRETKNKSSKCGKRRCDRRDRNSSSSDGEEECCMYCSRSRSLIKLPCGRRICSKCEENAEHQVECKQCKVAEKHRVYT